MAWWFSTWSYGLLSFLDERQKDRRGDIMITPARKSLNATTPYWSRRCRISRYAFPNNPQFVRPNLSGNKRQWVLHARQGASSDLLLFLYHLPTNKASVRYQIRSLPFSTTSVVFSDIKWTICFILFYLRLFVDSHPWSKIVRPWYFLGDQDQQPQACGRKHGIETNQCEPPVIKANLRLKGLTHFRLHLWI